MAADTSPLRVPDPMLATLGAPPAGPGWAVEFKWDGFRGRLRSAGSTVSVYTRNGAEALSTFRSSPVSRQASDVISSWTVKSLYCVVAGAVPSILPKRSMPGLHRRSGLPSDQ